MRYEVERLGRTSMVSIRFFSLSTVHTSEAFKREFLHRFRYINTKRKVG